MFRSGQHKEQNRRIQELVQDLDDQNYDDCELDMEDEEVYPMHTKMYNRKDDSIGYLTTNEQTVHTTQGDINVAIQGDKDSKKPVIVTLHDIGQNHTTCFQSFFCFHQFKPCVDKFTVYHLNFPGQHENADELPEDCEYPTMEEMVDALQEVFTHYALKNCVLFGVGAGANVFTRLSMRNPKLVDCMILVNCNAWQSSWTEWTYEKMTSHYLRSVGMTSFCQDYLVWHKFGYINENTNHDLLELVKDQLTGIRHPRNLALLIDSYSKRTLIKVERPDDPDKPHVMKCGTLQLCGWESPAIDATVDLHSRLDPTRSEYIKVSDSTSMVLEEQPNTAANAIINFLRGYGYVMKMKAPPLVTAQIVDPASIVGAPVC